MERVYYVTTPIYYISGNPHIGHAYTTVVADVLARTARTSGESYFLTGVDEHGQKVANAAAAAGKSPQEWCDQLVPRWKSLFEAYNVRYDDFIRTTEPRHERVVQAVFERLRTNGDIYLGTYEGWYCVNDETFWLESRLVDGRCPTCGREVQWLSEDAWFFRLSAYRDRLLEHFRANPDWVRPRSVYNEMMAILESGLEDLSISRQNFSWGIEIPGGGSVVYVWFDALLNYISAIGWTGGADAAGDERFHRYWPAKTQLVGKEIARFHTIIWPAVLWAIGERAPELVYAHGWITVDGQKIGKSLGNAVDAFSLAERFGADAVRYFLLREAPFGSDFSYSEDKIAQRYNAELGNDLGNLVRRTLAMLAKYCDGVVPEPHDSRVSEFGSRFTALSERVRGHLLQLDFREALTATWELVTALNRRIDDEKPWTLAKSESERDAAALRALMYDLCEGLRWLAMLLHPVMPERTAEIWRQLGLSTPVDGDWDQALQWGRFESGTVTSPGDAIFPRIEIPAPA